MIKEKSEFYCFVKDKLTARSIIKVDDKVFKKK